MKMKFGIFAAAVFAIFCVSACEDIALRGVIEDLIANSDSTVYTSGYFRVGTNQKPCYWTGSVKTDLTVSSDTDTGSAKSITVLNSTVYTAGTHVGAGPMMTACYWIGAGRNDLTTGSEDADAASVYAFGGNVYISGHAYDADLNHDVPCCWMNDVSHKNNLDIDAAPAYGDALGIFVDSSGVYAAGFMNNGFAVSNPCFWDGAARTDISIPSAMGQAAAIFPVGSNMNIAGYYWDGLNSRTLPCHWVGGALAVLENGIGGGQATSIFVYDNIVYVGGWYNDGSKDVACYWRDGVRVDLPGDGVNNAHVRSLLVFHGMVYAAGDYSTGVDPHPCYWKDGVRNDLLPGDQFGSALSIYVTWP